MNILRKSFHLREFLNPTSLLTRIGANKHATQTAVVNQSNTPEELDKLYSRLEIEVKGNDPAVLKSYSWFSTTAAGHLGIEIGRCWANRKAQHERLTLLKSVHIYKKHRVQYEIRTYFRFMHFHKLTGSTLDTFLEYLERNLPEGVALKATKIEVQDMPEHLKEAPVKVENKQGESNT